ncbi:LysR family transcriptional regulator [Kutzneria sp. CA-103260]|uniref:LysR family transcriptional regulator n=1 Tax=Kutzneria sp. CA-103260 TaxID=2802641 RepID=UPI001BA63923|nr:LysR family transcriptional regulator [Kutzneria sp. CA-103260]QUQ65158.1 LysR family transcriptional regulator [Kutzneria sp. CA-103260]
MDHRQLTTFRMVCHTRSITRAAAELGYSQSAVTSQVKGLESMLRVSLFERRRDGVRLTAFGERFLPYAERMLALADEARTALHADGALAGTVIVGAGESVMTYRLPALVEALHHRHPDIRLSLRIFREGQALRALERDEIDVCLLSAVDEPAGDFQVRDLGVDDIVLVAAPNHSFDRDLAGCRFLIAQPDCLYARILAAEIGAPADSALQLGTLEGVKKAVAAGLGVALLPRVVVADLVADGEAAILPWRAANPARLYAAWTGKHEGSRELDAVVALMSRASREDLRLVS